MRTITAVENEFNTSFWAVADFNRVDPAIASGPVSTLSSVSTRGASGPIGFDVISAVWAPTARVRNRAPPTYAVQPEDASPGSTLRTAAGTSASSSLRRRSRSTVGTTSMSSVRGLRSSVGEVTRGDPPGGWRNRPAMLVSLM